MPNKNSGELAKAFGYLTEKEIEMFKKTVNTLPRESTCINIGAGAGTSGLVFMESRRVGKLYTIDIRKEGNPFGGLGNELVAFKEAGFEHDIRHTQIHGDSTEVGLTWIRGEVDMVFIDGDHSYEHCCSDAFAWLGNLYYGGVIAFHDYAESPWGGVWKCVNEYFINKYKLLFHGDTYIAFSTEIK